MCVRERCPFVICLKVYYLVIGLRSFRENSLAQHISEVGKTMLGANVWKGASVESGLKDREASDMRFKNNLLVAEDTIAESEGVLFRTICFTFLIK